MLNAKGKYVRLEGKGWRRLQYDLSEDENERLARLGLSPRELSAEPQRLHALQLADEAAKKFLPEQQVEQIQRRVERTQDPRRARPCPPASPPQLRPYQLEGFHFLAYLVHQPVRRHPGRRHGPGQNPADPGLAALAAAGEGRRQRSTGGDAAAKTAALHGAPLSIPPVLVVCPKSVMDNWHAEAARFTPGLRVRVWSASELDSFEDELRRCGRACAQLQPAPDAGREPGAGALAGGDPRRRPVHQEPELADRPGRPRLARRAPAGPHRHAHRKPPARLVEPDGFRHARRAGQPRPVRPALRRQGRPLRPPAAGRARAAVSCCAAPRPRSPRTCPTASRRICSAKSKASRQTLYRAELKRAQQLLLGSQDPKGAGPAAIPLPHLAAAPAPDLLPPAPASSPTPPPPAPRLEALLEQLEPLMEEGQKVLVFSQFVEMLDLLRPALMERDWPHLLPGRRDREPRRAGPQFPGRRGPGASS